MGIFVYRLGAEKLRAPSMTKEEQLLSEVARVKLIRAEATALKVFIIRKSDANFP